MAEYTLDDLVAIGAPVEIQRQVLRYDVQWGQPFDAITYKRLVLSSDPAYYWKMEQINPPNHGNLQPQYPLQNFGVVSLETGVVDPTDSAMALNGQGYGKSVPNSNLDVGMANGYTVGVSFYVNGIVNQNVGLISKAFNTGDASNTFTVYLSAGNTLTVCFRNGVIVTPTVAIPVQQWTNFIMTVQYVNNLWTVNIYINGLVVGTYTGPSYEPWYSAPTINPTQATPIIVGAIPQSGGYVVGSYFPGAIDEVFINYNVMSTRLIAQLAVLAQNSSYLQPHEILDTDAIQVSPTAQTWQQLVATLRPLHWWSFDSLVNEGDDLSGDTVTDIGNGTTNALTIYENTGMSTPIGPYDEPYGVQLDPGGISKLNGINNRGIQLRNDGSSYPTNNRLEVTNLVLDSGSSYSPGEATYIPFVIAFWYTADGSGNGPYGIMGFDQCFRNGAGFNVQQADEGGGGFTTLTFSFYTEENGKLYEERITGTNVALNTRIGDQNNWNFIVCQVDVTGYAQVYVNGGLNAVAQFTKNRGLSIPNIDGGSPTQPFIIGPTVDRPNAVPVGNFYQEILMFDNLLTAVEISNLFNTGFLGPYHTININDDNLAITGAPYIIGSNPYSLLINEQDVSKYVQSYALETNLRQIVDTGTLTLTEKWREAVIAGLFVANTYVIIKERWVNKDYNYDSGWQDVCHALVEGPVGNITQGEGSRSYQLIIKGLLSLLNLDICHYDRSEPYIEPDLLFVAKTQLSVVTTYEEYTQFQVQHPLVSSQVMYNWAEAPSVLLWAHGFKNLLTITGLSDITQGGVTGYDDTIRVKGSDGSIQVLGGTGAVLINNKFLQAAVSDIGMGNPDYVYAQFYRYATIEDVERNLQIVSINYSNGRWFIITDRAAVPADNKRVFMKSGNALGKQFIAKQLFVGNNNLDSNTVGNFTAQGYLLCPGSSLGNWDISDGSSLTMGTPISGSVGASISGTTPPVGGDLIINSIDEPETIYPPSYQLWVSSLDYGAQTLVQYKGVVYKALVGTVNQEPDINPLVWESLVGANAPLNTPPLLSNYLKISGIQSSNSFAQIPPGTPVSGIQIGFWRQTNIGINAPESAFILSGGWGTIQAGPGPSGGVLPIYDNHVFLSKDGTFNPGEISEDRASLKPWSNMVQYNSGDPIFAGGTATEWEYVEYGGDLDLWGFSSMNVAELAEILPTLTLLISVGALALYLGDAPNNGSGYTGIQTDLTNPGYLMNQGFKASITGLTLSVYLNDTIRLNLEDVNGLQISPYEEGIAVGDTLQLGDFNAGEDAVRKVLIANGFQENNPALPFYFLLDQCPTILAPSVPPLRPKLDDNQKWLDVMNDIMEYTPPDYRIRMLNTGLARANSIGLDLTQPPVHTLYGVKDMTEDKSTYNVVSRMIVEGIGLESINVALHQSYGGFATIRCCLLSDFASQTSVTQPDKSYIAASVALPQLVANDLMKYVISGNGTVPIPGYGQQSSDIPSGAVPLDGGANYYYGLNPTDWSYQDPTIQTLPFDNRMYGLIWNNEGTSLTSSRDDFALQPLFIVDIGRTASSEIGTIANANGNAIEIETIQCVWYNHFELGNALKQTVFVYYMSEQDYENEFGTGVPITPIQVQEDGSDGTLYFPPTTAKSWKLLLDEQTLQEGANVWNSSSFFQGLPVKARFIMFMNGQCHHRLPPIQVPNANNNVYWTTASRITITDVRVYSSNQIIATAELGVTPITVAGDTEPLNSADRKAMMTRIRRRSQKLAANPILNTYEACQEFAATQLLEMIQDFTPVNFTAFHPEVQCGDTVYFIQPEVGGEPEVYLIMSLTHNSDGTVTGSIINYKLEV